MKAIALVGLLAAPAFDQWQLEQEREDRLQCTQLLSARSFAKQELLDAIARYQRCVETPTVTGCWLDFDELGEARTRYQNTIDDAETLCLIPGAVASVPDP